MKKMCIVCLSILFLFSCAEDKQICGKTYEPKGMFTQDEKDENVFYKISAGNVIWGIILIETVVAPVYFWGFSIYQPVELKKGITCDKMQ